PRSEVRAAAARVINVTAPRLLLPSLLAALAVETDLDAASEEIAAVAALGGPNTDLTLLDAARRDRRLAPAVAATLGRARGRQALAHLPILRSLSLGPADLVRFLRLASGGEADVLVPAGAAALRDR